MSWPTSDKTASVKNACKAIRCVRPWQHKLFENTSASLGTPASLVSAQDMGLWGNIALDALRVTDPLEVRVVLFMTEKALAIRSDTRCFM